MVQLLKVPTSVGLAAPWARAPAGTATARAAVIRNLLFIMAKNLVGSSQGSPVSTGVPVGPMDLRVGCSIPRFGYQNVNGGATVPSNCGRSRILTIK
jgi:hypothetical protein